jgi:hypothetical protein
MGNSAWCAYGNATSPGEPEDFGGRSSVSLLGLGRLRGTPICQYVPFLLKLTELFAQLTDLFPLFGGRFIRPIAIISIGLLQPIADGLFCGFKLFG